MLLIIDNFDSFTYNLVQYFGELSATMQVYLNNQLTIADIIALNPAKIVISPGPGNPDNAGISLNVIKHFAGKIPILGICLGHQCIAQAFGGTIIHAKKLVHGKVSAIHHQQQGIFKSLATPFNATRYHSLVVDAATLPDCFEITAHTVDDTEIMGIRHKTLAIEGVQFHPEAILTEHGHQLLKNFLETNINLLDTQK